MTYGEISPAVRGFIGGWEAFRKLGFRSSDIFFHTCTCVGHGKLCIMVCLRTQGRELNLEVAHIESEEAEVEHYQVVAQAILDGRVPQEVLDRMWQESEAFQKASLFVAAVVAKGFVLPGSSAS